MSDFAMAGMVVMGLGCVTLGLLGTLAICYARAFMGKATKDNIEVKVNTDPKPSAE